MSLTKEECENSLSIISSFVGFQIENLNDILNNKLNATSLNSMRNIALLIKEHFDNPPLKFEELKPDMWVWDKKHDMWNKILEIRINCAGEQEIEFEYSLEREEEFYNDTFENDRFYRKQVEYK